MAAARLVSACYILGGLGGLAGLLLWARLTQGHAAAPEWQGFAAIGCVQTALMAPAWHLGKGRLRALSLCLLSLGGLCTAALAVGSFAAAGADREAAWRIALCLSLFCAAPLIAHLFARRRPAPAVPATV